MSIKADVDRGLEIRATVEKLAKEMKEITARLTQAALHGEQVELTDADREGRQYLATGTERVVPIILTADKLIGEFAANSEKHKTILAVTPDRLGPLLEFFKPVNKFENRFDNGKKFRARAFELLGKDAPQFITACVARDKDGIAKSDIKIMWDDAAEKN